MWVLVRSVGDCNLNPILRFRCLRLGNGDPKMQYLFSHAKEDS